MSQMHDFIQAVLGDTAAQALAKAADRSEALGSILGPRVILGWLGFASQWSYSGEIPGLPGSTLRFQKNQQTELFEGALTVGNDVFDFEHASPTQLAATLTVALGANRPVSKALRDGDLVGLGKNIDLLIRSQVVRLMKGMQPKDEFDTIPCPRSTCKPGFGAGECPACNGSGYVKVGRPQGKTFSGEVKKAAQQPSGTQAKPRGPLEPEAPDPQRKQQQRQQPPPPPPSKLKLTKSQAATRCSVCEAPSFNRRGEFTGCWCFREMARFAKSEPQQDGGYLLTLGPQWTRSNLRVFLDIVGAGEA